MTVYEFFKVFINGRHFYDIFYFEGFKRLYHRSIGVEICSIVVYAYYEFHVYFAKKRDVQTLTEVSKEINAFNHTEAVRQNAGKNILIDSIT